MMKRRELLRTGLGLAALASTPSPLAAAVRKNFFAAHGLPIGLQLYTLGDAPTTDLEGTLKRVAEIGYRTIEVPGIRAGTASQIRAAADKAGLTITSLHLGANRAMAGKMMTLLDEPAQIATEMRTLDCSNVVLPFPVLPAVKPQAGEDFRAALLRAFTASGAELWEQTAALLNERGEALRREGVSLSYHNHSLEFLPVGAGNGWDILVAQTDPKLVSFEVDVAWAVVGGHDPVAFVEGLAGRVRQLHVKDLLRPAKPGVTLSMESTEVGSGIIEWKKLLPAAYRAGTRQFYVEQEPPFQMDRFDSIAKSYAYLSRL